MTTNTTRFFSASPRRRVTASRFQRGVAALLLSLFFAVPTFAQSALDRVHKSGELRIGTDATYPPFETAEGGQYTGFDIDLGTAIARELGVKPRFVNAAFDGIFPALQNGTFDVVMSSVTITPERSASMLFSDPYYDSGQLIVVNQDRQGITTPDDLKGKTVGVQINTTAQFDLEKKKA